MAFYTGGYKVDTWIEVAAGEVTSATTHFDIEVVRAWQGHTIESRWFHCVNGSFNVKLVEIDNWENPSNDLKVFEYELTAEKQEILYQIERLKNTLVRRLYLMIL